MKNLNQFPTLHWPSLDNYTENPIEEETYEILILLRREMKNIHLPNDSISAFNKSRTLWKNPYISCKNWPDSKVVRPIETTLYLADQIYRVFEEEERHWDARNVKQDAIFSSGTPEEKK